MSPRHQDLIQKIQALPSEALPELEQLVARLHDEAESRSDRNANGASSNTHLKREEANELNFGERDEDDRTQRERRSERLLEELRQHPEKLNSAQVALLSITGLGASEETDVSVRDEEILESEIDPIHGWSVKK
ncbi:MAG: hypothetical protein AAFX40_16715 [Cyanobacteria bacterium J06639_1]